MECGFKMKMNAQQEWSWLLAIDLFFGGLGGALFLLFQFFHLRLRVAALALGLMVIGAAFLMAELGHPLRAWRTLARLRTSWISRGVLFVNLFLGAGALYILTSWGGLTWLPWTQDGAVAKVLLFLAGLSAVMVTLYPGFVLAASPSVPFWNSPMLPVLFFTQSVLTASGIVLLLSRWNLSGGSIQPIESLALYLIIGNFLLLTIYLISMNKAGRAAKEAVRLLTHPGSLAWIFGAGALLVGLILPMVIVLWVPTAAYLAGALILCGALLFRYCVLKAGVYVPFHLM